MRVVVIYFFFNLGARWGVWSMTHSYLFTHCQETGTHFRVWNCYNFLSIYSPFFRKLPIFRRAQLKALAVERNVRYLRKVPFRNRAGAEVYLHLFLPPALESWLVKASPSLLYLQERYPVPTAQEGGWVPGPIRGKVQMFFPTQQLRCPGRVRNIRKERKLKSLELKPVSTILHRSESWNT
jgi:hypothetical protein